MAAFEQHERHIVEGGQPAGMPDRQGDVGKSQSSSWSPTTRLNSPVLWVTNVHPLSTDEYLPLAEC